MHGIYVELVLLSVFIPSSLTTVSIWYFLQTTVILQRDPAFKKVRHCFYEKVSPYKKVFSLKKYHFLITSQFMDHHIIMSLGQALSMVSLLNEF